MRLKLFGIPMARLMAGVAMLLICGCGSDRPKKLREQEIREFFETGTGLPVPASATEFKGWKSPSDFFGDYSVVIAFRVSADAMGSLKKPPATAWLHPEQFNQTLTVKRNLAGMAGDFSKIEGFVAPAFAHYIQQSGPGDLLRFYAIDEAERRVFFFRATW